MIFEDKQIEIIKNAKSYLEKVKKAGIDTSLSSFCYFSSWSQTPGYAKLKLKSSGWSFAISYFNILFKNILSIAAHSDFAQIENKNSIKDYKMVILSWSYKENFHSDGSFQDKYFNESSKNIESSYWILVSMDGYVPLNLNDNIKIIKRKKGIFKYNFYFLIKLLILTIIECKFSLRKIYHYFFFPSYFAKLITKIVIKDIKESKAKLFLLPYEAQPFQNKIFFEVKKISSEIESVGYLHSLTPLTSELIYRSGAPDSLLIPGENQIKMLKSNLNWPEERLILVDSLRIQNNANQLSRKIFVPMVIDDANIFLKEFTKLLINAPKNNFPILSIKNHPTSLKSKKHIYFVKKLEKIMNMYKDRFSENATNKNISIVFGVTAAILECLQKKISVIHVCSDPLFQSYNSKIWPNFIVKKLSKLVFSYNLSVEGKTVSFGEKKILSQTLKTIF